MSPSELLSTLPPWARVAAALAAGALVGLLAYVVVYVGLGRLGRRVPALLLLDGALLRRTRAPARLLLPLVGVHATLPLVRAELGRAGMGTAERLLHVLLVAAVAWGLIALTRVLDDVVERRFDVAVPDNLRARRVRTQVGVLRRVLVIVIVAFALGAVLVPFQGFRALGAGLLASASVVSIVVGIAAQRPLGNIVAGVQLALTQPIRVGDAVVLEEEWGTVEEITLTYVVVRIWDQRRLVLPISHFFEKPFQNWTRRTAQVIGAVYLYVDWTAPVPAIREAFERIVAGSTHWDGQVRALQVSDASERTIQLRVIMSAPNAGSAWDLRCEVREGLVAFLQAELPWALPKVRMEHATRPPETVASAAGE